MQSFARSYNAPSVVSPRSLTGHAAALGQAVPPSLPSVGIDRRLRSIGRFVAVLLLVIVPAASSFAGHGQFLSGWGNRHPALIPAPFATPTTSEETLLQVTFPAESRSVDSTFGWLARFTFAPGASLTDPIWRTGSRVSFEYIVKGSEIATSPAPGWVLRAGAGGAPTSYRAGEEISLNVGDALVLLQRPDPSAAGLETRRNPGTTELVVYTGGEASAVIYGPYNTDPSVAQRDFGFVDPSMNLVSPPGPLQITMSRVSLAGGDVLKVPANGRMIVGVESDDLTLKWHLGAGTLTNDGTTPLTVIMLTYISAGSVAPPVAATPGNE